MKQLKKKTVEIPQVIYTDQFLRFVAIYANRFKASNGYGKWLVEYKRMDESGWFKPEKLREFYADILKGTSTLSFIYKDAVCYICAQALNATKTFASVNSFDIRVITGEIAINDNDEELTGLSIEEAISICDSMNEEAEEILFRVYNSSTNRIVK